ncbi:hypothetical protein B4100_0203 [Heyndrickxia coagulans]|nr:hypothetical protein B4100_0203 [Heyndrickxia coagulans]
MRSFLKFANRRQKNREGPKKEIRPRSPAFAALGQTKIH